MNFRTEIQRIAGETYGKLKEKTDPIKNELLFEAENFVLDAAKWPIHMKELILNFEETMVADDLIRAMNHLRMAEKAGDAAKMAEWAQRSQELSLKKAEVGKKRRK